MPQNLHQIWYYITYISHTSEFPQHFSLSVEEDIPSNHNSENHICNVVGSITQHEKQKNVHIHVGH